MAYKHIIKFALLLLQFVYCFSALAQQKESTVSVSCYVNPQLYIQAGVIAYVSDKAGNVSCTGKYIHINNQSSNPFHYRVNTRWIMIKPGGKTVVLVPGNTSAKAASVLKLTVKYSPDASGNIDAKMRAMAQMNAQSDQVKARELSGDHSSRPEISLNKPPEEDLTATNKPSPREPASPAPAKTSKGSIRKPAVARAKPATTSGQVKSESGLKEKEKAAQHNPAPNIALGLRIDFGTGSTGFGPNIKYKFNRHYSLDAAILFFEENLTGLSVQVEQSFPVKGTSGLDWYIGIGPQFLFETERTAIVPVTGLQYNIPGAPLNFSLDWRPNFHLSSGTDVEAGRFGLSLRVAL